MRESWDKIFDEPSGKRAWTNCIIFALLGIIAITIIKIFVSGKLEIGTNYYIVWDAFSNTTIAVLTGVLGAAILNIFYRVYESKKLKRIKSISYDDLLIDIFKALERVDGRYRKDEHIELKIVPFYDENKVVSNLYDIRIRYEFKTKINNPYFQCYVMRLYNGNLPEEEDNVSRYSSGTDDRLKKYEFYWMNDETEFGNSEEYKVGDNDYKIYDCFIGSYKADDVVIEDREIPAGKELIYTMKIPEDKKLDLKEEQIIRFTVSLPMEKESILFLTHEYPTKDTEVIIDNSLVLDKMILYTLPVTGAMQVQKQMSMEDGKEYYSYSGWMLPKSGYVVSWWDR